MVILTYISYTNVGEAFYILLSCDNCFEALVKHMSSVLLAYAARIVGICRTYGWHMSYVLSAYVSPPPPAHAVPA